MDKPKISLVELFSGVGFQRMGMENCDLYNIESVATCDMDNYAVIAYAAIHCGMTQEMVDTYGYPSREEMAQDLIKLNMGYDFKKQKKYDWYKKAKGKDQFLNKVWLACKLSNNLGDISCVMELPKCNMMTYSFPCFVEGTLVLTQDGYKEIQEVEVGDQVLTHTNNWQSVTKTMTNEADKLIKIHCMPSEDIYCTPNHPFYVRLKKQIYKQETRGMIRAFEDPEWVEAKNLSSSYYIGMAINQKGELPNWDGFEKNTTWGHTEHVNTLSELFPMEEFWYVIGRYIADGWTRPNSGIIICSNDFKIGQIITRLDILGWNYNIAKEKTVNKICIPFQEIGKYCERFGKGAANKHLGNDILNLPKKQLTAFLEGYLDGDGCFSQDKFKITSVSRILIYETVQCIAKAYHSPCSVYFTRRPNTTVIEGRTVNQKDTYSINFKNTRSTSDKAFYENGYIWYPIHDIAEEEYKGLVYNLEVENDNSYQVQNVIAHNCTDLSIAGAQAGMEVGTRSGLVYEVLRLLRASHKPEYLLMENVDALTSKKFKAKWDLIVDELSELGYNTYYKVLNGKECGIPQNRKRVFGLSIRKDIDTETFTFPTPFDNGKRLKDILLPSEEVDEKYYIENDRSKKLIEDLIANGSLKWIDEELCTPNGEPFEEGIAFTPKSKEQIESEQERWEFGNEKTDDTDEQ